MPRQTADYDPMMDELPPELAAEYMAEKRRRKISEAMLGQSQTPLVAPEVKGRFQGAISPWQGIAKIAEAYMANKGLEGSGAAMADILKRNAGMQAEAISKYKENTIGTPEGTQMYPSGGNPDEPGGMGFKPAFTPTPEQRQAAIADAMVANNPRLNKMGALDFALNTRKEDRAAATEDKLFQLGLVHRQELERIKERAIEQRISKEEAQAQMIAANERNARLIASLRAPTEVQPLVQVVGDDGKPKWVERKDAIGKTPAGAGSKAESIAAGKEEIDRDVITLKSALDQLKADGGITSTENGVIQNIGSWAANTGVGQTLGSMGGTTNQKARDVILQARPLMLRSIMQATGMSAKNLDSNAELKLWLATATDPTKGYEANIEALNNIASKYGSGGFMEQSKNTKIKPNTDKSIVREVQLKDGRIGVEYSDGTRGYK